MSADGWSTARRILCVRLDNMGDVLMTTPAIRAIRENRPDAHIALLASPAGAAIGAMIPEIDKTLVYRAPWMKDAPGPVDADLDMVDRLSRESFEAAVIFTAFSQNALPAALLCRLANIPLVLAHSRERAYALLSNEIPETEPGAGIRHEVQRQLDLVKTLGWRSSDTRLSLAVPDAARRDVAHLIPPQPWAVLHPCATASSRRYPHFAAVSQRLTHNHGWHVCVTGSADEAALGDGMAGTNLAGKLSLAAFVALVAAAPLVITNNSGPAHIAAAVGTPVVDLYALTNPQHTPWQVANRVLSHDVPCRWCFKSICPEGHHHCLSLIDPETVVSAVLNLARRPMAA